jgi:ubiquinone/menaquinone biosynthesis C-methylase UbiE
MARSKAYRDIVKVKESYDQIAIGYNRVRAQPWKECVNFVRSFNAGSLVLDLGCGNGRHTMSSVLQGHETIGVDFSKNMLTVAKKKLKSIQASVDIFHFVLADISHLPFRNDSFDNILYIATLHNLPARSLRIESLHEVRRVLKAGGKCLISVWRRLQFRFLFAVVKTYLKKIVGMEEDFEVYLPWKMDGLLVHRYYYLYNAKQLRKDIKETGMNIVNFSKVKIGTRIISDNYFVTITKTK